MINIKYIWLYVAVFLAGSAGYGASYFLPVSSHHDLEQELRLAHQQIEELRIKCERTAMKRVPIKRGRSEEF